MAKFNTIKDLDAKGKVVFVRADLNVPFKDGKVTDTTRIDRFVPTVKALTDKGAKVVIASHFGRPKGQVVPEMSLGQIVPDVEKALGRKIVFVDDCIGPKVESAIKAMKDGDVVMLENLRFYAEEEKNEPEFALNQPYAIAYLMHGNSSTLTMKILQLPQDFGCWLYLIRLAADTNGITPTDKTSIKIVH